MYSESLTIERRVGVVDGVGKASSIASFEAVYLIHSQAWSGLSVVFMTAYPAPPN